MKMYGGADVYIHVFLTSALAGICKIMKHVHLHVIALG
jgi:hypothetical protein